MSFICSISEQPIKIGTFLDSFNNPGHGALTTFFGIVREQNRGRHVLAIDYDAFLPLTKNCFDSICSEAQTQWGDNLRVALTHRMGRLHVGDISVAIAVSSTHRDESFLATRYLIEQLKTRAPIWKKEYYSDGESEWIKGHSLCQHATA